MSAGRFLQQAAAGNAGGGVYVDDVFSTYLYDGTGSAQTITNGIDVDGEGGLVWIKGRTQNIATQDHRLVDTARGVNQAVSSSTNDNVLNITGEFTSFNSDGFTLASTSGNGLNRSGEEYVSWTFRNQPGFFQVLTYEGNGTAGRTVGHSLGSVPGCIMVKAAESGVGFNGDWLVYHRGNTAAPETDRLILNSTAATADSNSFWNDTAPTATEFTLGANSDVNGNGVTYVAYLFAHDAQDFGTDSDESIIKCGSYTGNGSAAGPEIDLGWEPQWVMIKSTGGAYGWIMHDTMRGWTADGKPIARLRADQGGAEYNDANYTEVAVTPTGFRLTNNHPSTNGSGIEYIYVAIRRPMKPPEFGTEVFTPAIGTTDYIGPQFDATFSSVDLILEAFTTSGGFSWVDRVRGDVKRLKSSSTAAEVDSEIPLDMMYGAGDGGSVYDRAWMFRRAPGFFDVVAYTGTNTLRTVDHNLGVAPELVIIKIRNTADNWEVWTSYTPMASWYRLNDTSSSFTPNYFDNTSPTSTQFTLKSSGVFAVNQSGYNYIAYLFASVPGISKVGSYTGTGSDVDVNCGFTSGARFVLVKRTDSTGDWYVWDSERGIVAGNDPYLLLNTTAAQVTSTDYIDPLSSGFTITSSAPAALNASGGSYIFLAIA